MGKIINNEELIKKWYWRLWKHRKNKEKMIIKYLLENLRIYSIRDFMRLFGWDYRNYSYLIKFFCYRKKKKNLINWYKSRTELKLKDYINIDYVNQYFNLKFKENFI